MRSSSASLKLSQTQSRSGFAAGHEGAGERERERSEVGSWHGNEAGDAGVSVQGGGGGFYDSRTLPTTQANEPNPFTLDPNALFFQVRRGKGEPRHLSNTLGPTFDARKEGTCVSCRTSVGPGL